MNKLLLITALLVSYTSAACQNPQKWVPILEADYDRTFSDVSQVTKRPLGFMTATHIYDSPNTLCVEVDGTAVRRVEVKVETYPVTTICVRSGDESVCAEADGRISLCQNFASENSQQANSTRFEFFCNNECNEADVTYWYRFVVSPGISSDGDEIWCGQRDSRYPTDLQTISFVITTEDPGPGINSAAVLAGSLCPCLAMLLGMAL